MLLTAALLSLFLFESPFYSQKRVGLNKVEFRLYKFKSMKNGVITLSGKVIRKTGIDEFPQLINIIKGEMNFVGPRPLTNSDIIRLGWDGESKSMRWNVKPGITGLAQLQGVCDKELSIENDMTYIHHQSTSLDLKIIWRSILIPFIGKGKAKQLIHR